MSYANGMAGLRSEPESAAERRVLGSKPRERSMKAIAFTAGLYHAGPAAPEGRMAPSRWSVPCKCHKALAPFRVQVAPLTRRCAASENLFA